MSEMHVDQLIGRETVSGKRVVGAFLLTNFETGEPLRLVTESPDGLLEHVTPNDVNLKPIKGTPWSAMS